MFKIPAGADNHEVTACQTLPADIQVLSYMPHMHLRGKDMKYEVVYPDGRRETLLWVPKFSFNWQDDVLSQEAVDTAEGQQSYRDRPFRQLGEKQVQSESQD